MKKLYILTLICAVSLVFAAGCEKQLRLSGGKAGAGQKGSKESSKPQMLLGLTGGELLFQEDFGKDLAHWDTRSRHWRIVDGRLYTGDGKNNNEGLWLKGIQLPADVRIEFEATSVKGNNKVFQGDIKVEFGGPAPEHVSGYVALFGGWDNSLSAICKGDEHGEGRLAIDTERRVEENKTYKFAVARVGTEVFWYLDGALFLYVKDDAIIKGGSFGFNNWNSRVYFDNLKIYAL